ncbi:hypothetical protein [Halococcus salifodinae]|uniref:Uncharacterized protein n=1 Tax=Halococcus salifodinae DSM 8989 TaxID=1227456 RepID=M0N116_9EURY|nr:hypothetical protein [Halococcus salifodinae]EMA51248.1 hypothetical protein C450_12250 [Halococcus salifodinae DSM 8989]
MKQKWLLWYGVLLSIIAFPAAALIDPTGFVLLAFSGIIFVISGLKQETNIGPWQIPWWQVGGVGFLALIPSFWLIVFSVYTGTEIPLIYVFTVLVSDMTFVGIAIELLIGGRYLFPDMTS